MPETLDTNAKALRINLDPTPYGTFAEIGGGQEVSRWFFRVGGAAGTVAKSMSAYDMTVSDSIYGSGARYVSRERLGLMLDYEFKLLVERLGQVRGEKTAFFVLADTVATRNFKGTNECHGWIGLRVQHRPGAAPSDMLVHVSLRDPTAILQQQTLGVFGVNLLFAAVYLRESRAGMLRSLMDGLSLDNIEVDVVDCTGPAFEDLADCKAVALDLLAQGAAHAVAFDERGRMEQPSTVFRKRGLLVHRCSLTRDNPEMERMMTAAERLLKAEASQEESEPLGILELSLAGVRAPGAQVEGQSEGVDPRKRLDWLVRPGQSALVTNYAETFQVSLYLRRFSTEPVRFVVGLDAAIAILNDRFYAGIDGGVLEALGRLLAPNVKLYVFSMSADVLRARLARYGVGAAFCNVPDRPSLTIADVKLAPPAGYLMDFLLSAGWVVGAEIEGR